MMSLAQDPSPHAASALTNTLATLSLAGLIAWRGHRAAVACERDTGRSPYGWEPVTWSIICFCGFLFGRLLLAAGASRERKRPRPFPTGNSWSAEPEQPWASPMSGYPPFPEQPAFVAIPPTVVAPAPVIGELPVLTGPPRPAAAHGGARVASALTILPSGPTARRRLRR